MIIRGENLYKKYRRLRGNSNYFFAVKGAYINAKPGIITAIIGESGGGKTTLITMLAGLLRPTDGRILIDDTDIYSLTDSELSDLRNRSIGFVPQVVSGVPGLNVAENVMLPCAIGTADDKVEERARVLMDELDISDVRDASMRELSGGEMKRVSLARALMNDPGIILLDEPTNDLDKENKAIILDLLKRQAEKGCTVVVVTHEDDVQGMADETYEMVSGELSFGVMSSR